ncbi:cell division cycle-associated protein 2 isoform X1 [Rhinopithecus roxellana]|uniref:cell division cycle-associated protein 2 isoform X1 n=1 Tax=Rhinopithecus roxellana TaxID=61622 RepID=UPI0012376304|nr:cell division cycle-associated protein 2 isoform X1 [Rhinopithecus roxellana]XP_030794075.1 cell division cycle-associated protein 2 isoform X1 [Rhinopithecus roxellana]
MDANSKDKPPETKESAMNNAGNASFSLGTGKIMTPQKHAELPPNPCTPDTLKSPLNFSTVTVEQLGITPESFVRHSTGKSSSYLKKSRRRSAVGARGSPETNHLIRFIARQQNIKNARKSPLAQDSPFQGSPALYRNVNSLRERISAFQSAFHSIKENEKMTDCPEFSEAGRESEMTDLTRKEGLNLCQQSGFPAVLSSKRRRISYQRDSDENLTDAKGKVIGLQILNIDTDRACAVETSADLSEKSSKRGSIQSGVLVEESLPLSELTETSNALKVADCVVGKGSSDAVSPDMFTAEVSSDAVPDVRSPATPACRRDLSTPKTFVLRSVLKKPSVKMCLESLQEHCNNVCDDDGTHPSLISNLPNCCKDKEAKDEENFEAPAFLNMRKRKRVTFGEDLSPEVFDESLPANTPLRKGGTPVCKKDFDGLSSLLLEQSPVPEPLPQPDFDDKGENLENIEPLQVSFAVLSSPNKSSISETLSGSTDTFSSSNNHEKISSHKVGRITRTSNRRNQLVSFVEENVCNLLNTEVQPCKEKKSNRRKSQETKCTKRTLPKKNQVLKSCRKKKRKGKKSVQKSLYGERDIASKKPLLSPIPELPEVSEMTPSVPSIRRLGSGYFNSNGKLEEVKAPKNPVKRKDLFPHDPDLHMHQGFDKYDVSEFCSYMKNSSSVVYATSDEDPNTNIMNINENKNIPKAKNKSESENEPEAGADSPASCASVPEERVALDSPKPALTLQQSQEFAGGGENAENLCQILKISPDLNMKRERKDDFLVAAEGKLQCSRLMPNSQKDCHGLGDVLIENMKESKSQSEDLERKPMESSSVKSCRDRKDRRRSMYYSDGQSLHLEKKGNHTPSSNVGSSVEISLENSELFKDLSDAIEQTFRRRNSETKVRRSTRLQKDLENEGLVWISLPLPSTSQKAKRRTICTFDSSGFESMSPRKETVSSRQKPQMAPPVSDQENSQGPAAGSSDEPGKRRKSFCISTLANTKATSQFKGYRRRSSLNGKGESSLNALERIEHNGEKKQ